MSLRKNLPALMAFLLAMGGVAYAQQPQTPPLDRGARPERMQEGFGRRLGRMGPHRMRGRFPGFRELNLTEDQRQQQRAIMQRNLESIRGPREELFKLREKRMAGTFTADDEARAKALRQEIHNSMKGIHGEIEGILTPEQRTQLEQLKAEHKARREEMHKRRLERRENIPQ